MKLSWSHAVLYVQDQQKMLDFYTNVLGFEVTDRGPLAEGAPEIIFMSQQHDEHHQLAMIVTRKDDAPSNSVNHFAFRVEAFEDVRSLHKTLESMEGIKVGPLSHGNTLSIYFNDPESNGLEVFWDTPWHVQQPQGKPWDPAMDEGEALKWVEDNFKDEPGFVPSGEYIDRRKQELG